MFRSRDVTISRACRDARPLLQRMTLPRMSDPSNQSLRPRSLNACEAGEARRTQHVARCLALLALFVGCGGQAAGGPEDAGTRPLPTPSAPPAVLGDASTPPVVDAGVNDPVSTCADPGTGLAGASYEIAGSHFAFGSPPAKSTVGSGTKWSGVHGVVFIGVFGNALGTMNAGAPESALPDWSNDADALAAHVRAYWIAMGIPSCQIQSTEVTAGGGAAGPQRTVFVLRVLDTIPIVDSKASARVNNADQSTSEGFLWPAIPSSVVASARAFRSVTAEPGALALYKATLPSAAQGEGVLVLHHSSIALMANSPFRAAATWDVTFGGAIHSYDAAGAEVPGDW